VQGGPRGAGPPRSSSGDLAGGGAGPGRAGATEGSGGFGWTRSGSGRSVASSVSSRVACSMVAEAFEPVRNRQPEGSAPRRYERAAIRR